MIAGARKLVSWWPPIVAAGATIVFWVLGAGKELWYSERFVQVIGNQSWAEMFSLLRHENNPPLWFILGRIWQSLVGTSEVQARYLTLLITLCFLVVLWWCARRMTNARVARSAVLLAACAGFVVAQSVEYRMYSFVLLLSTLALACAWTYVAHPSRHRLYALVVVNILGFYTHYTYVAVLVVTTAWVLWKQRSCWKDIAMSMAVLAAGIAPWLIVSLWPLLSDLGSTLSVQQQSAAWWSLVLLPFRTFVPVVYLEPRWLFVARMLVSALVLVSIVRAVKDGWRNRQSPALFLVLCVAGCIAVSTAFRLSLDKYAAAAVPAIVLVVASGIDSMARRWLRVSFTAFILVVSSLVSVVVAQTPNTTYREASAIVEAAEASGDVLLIIPFNDDIALRPYYHGSLTITGFFPAKEPGAVTLEDNISNNYKSLVTDDAVDQLAAYVGTAENVWVYYDIPISSGFWNGDLVDAWFRQNGYTRLMYRSAFHNVPPLLVKYSRTVKQ